MVMVTIFGVGDRDLRVERRQLEMLLVLLGTEVPAGEDQDHRVDALQLAQVVAPLVGIGELVSGNLLPGTMSARIGLLLPAPMMPQCCRWVVGLQP